MAYTRYMSRNPFKPTADQTTEYGWGAGRYPRADIDFSEGGNKSGIPIADPDRRQQHMDLAAAKRTDLNDPVGYPTPAFLGQSGPHPMHYALGNTERYGAQPPLVRERKRPPKAKKIKPFRPRMEREW